MTCDAQARVFSALWEHRERAQSSEFIMRAAGLDSEKPMDVFKLKAANRGDPVHEGHCKRTNYWSVFSAGWGCIGWFGWGR
jgi:hypothetical protein